MIARFDKVLAYSDQLEVSAAQEIANRFTRYWDKDSKNSDLVRFIHLGPMNNAYLLYVTALVNEAVLPHYTNPTPPSASRIDRSANWLAFCSTKPRLHPKMTQVSLKMEFIDDPDDVFSQRMRMVTGSLDPMVTADRQEEPVKNEITDQQEDRGILKIWRMWMTSPMMNSTRTNSTSKNSFPKCLHLTRMCLNLLSAQYQYGRKTTQTSPKMRWKACDISWDSDDSVDEEPPTPAPHVPERKPSPWETDGSLDLPETPNGKIAETPYSRWKTNTDKLKTPEPTDPDTGGREPYPWEMESSSPEEPTPPTEDTLETQPFPWELEADNASEPETPTHDAVESLRAPWSDTGSLDAIPSSAPEATEPKPQKTGPLNSQENNEENLNYPWQTGTGSLADSPPGEPEEPDENAWRDFPVHRAGCDRKPAVPLGIR